MEENAKEKNSRWLIQSGGGGKDGKESLLAKDKTASFFDLLYPDSERFFTSKLPRKNGKSVCIVQFFESCLLLRLECEW